METLKPKIVIRYEGKDISSDFSPILKEITYRDYLDGKASEISLFLSNSQGYFFGDWYPQISDKIDIMIGYEGSTLLDAGTFYTDETEMYGSSTGDEFTLRAMSIESSARNAAQCKACYNNKPIAEIINNIASTLGCKVSGDISGTFTGVQTETNLAFLNRIAKERGQILKIENGTIILHPINDLGKHQTLTLRKSDTLSYRISDVAAGRISRVVVKWWDTKTKKLIEGEYDIGVRGGGVIELWQQVESVSDAKERARNMVAERNKGGLSLEIDSIGDTRLRAGVAIELTEFGIFNAVYYISEARHTVSRSVGYTTRITLTKNR